MRHAHTHAKQHAEYKDNVYTGHAGTTLTHTQGDTELCSCNTSKAGNSGVASVDAAAVCYMHGMTKHDASPYGTMSVWYNSRDMQLCCSGVSTVQVMTGSRILTHVT